MFSYVLIFRGCLFKAFKRGDVSFLYNLLQTINNFSQVLERSFKKEDKNFLFKGPFEGPFIEKKPKNLKEGAFNKSIYNIMIVK